ncbi:hypothetical protein KY334_01350 [Candidatus Woesearchaeota archaeon]|nr:hypothetical protein [Candidatus Woesearchaeota archaeon]
MDFTKDEITFLRELVEREIDKFRKEGATIIDVSPQLLALEERYEDFMEDLIEKLTE